LTIGIKPKQTIFNISEDVLSTYTDKPLMDKYDVYQHLMNYWNEVMQDDCYLIAVDGWKAEPYRILIKNKATGKETDKGWNCDLVPKTLVIDRYFASEKQAIEQLESDKEAVATQITELEEEHSTEDGYFADFDKVNKANSTKRLKAIDTAKLKADNAEEIKVLKSYLKLIDRQAELNRKIKESAADLDKKLFWRYKTLTENAIKQLVVDDKWMATIEKGVKSEMERISQRLTQRIKELAERYETTIQQHNSEVEELEKRVTGHLEKMGFVWK
jgi:type I restriction enzyme M protein